MNCIKNTFFLKIYDFYELSPIVKMEKYKEFSIDKKNEAHKKRYIVKLNIYPLKTLI